MNELFNLFLQNVQEIIYVVEVTGAPFRMTVSFVSNQIETSLGYKPHEFVDDPNLWFSIIHPDDMAEVQRITRQMVETKQPRLRRYRVRHKTNGNYGWFEDKPMPLFDPSGRFTGYVGVAHDITERRRADEALRASQERLQTVLNNAPITIFAIDNKGVFTVSEGKGLQRVGLRPGENVGVSAYDLFGLFSVALQTGESITGETLLRRVLSGEALSGVTELRGVYFENQFVPLRDASEQVIGLIGVATDITERKKSEDELLKLSQALEHAADMVFITDKEGIIEYANAAFEKITGYSKSEILGKTPRILKSGEHAEEFYKAMWQELLAGNEFHFEFLNKKKNGGLYVDERTIVPLLNRQGVITHYVSIGRDITERKRAEEALRLNEQRLRIAISAADIAVFNQNTDLQYVWMHSPQLGYTTEQVVGKTDAELLPQQDVQKLTPIKRLVIETGKGAHEEVQIHTPDSVLTFELILEPLLNERGEVIGLTGSSMDISERKRMEEALQNSKEGYRNLVENISEIFFVCDSRGKLMYGSPNLFSRTGYKEDELMGQSYVRLIACEDRHRVADFYAGCTKDGTVDTGCEFRARLKDGSFKWVGQSTRIVRDPDGSAVEYRNVVSDITERKRAEESLRHANTRLRYLSHRLIEVQEAERRSIARGLHDEIGQSLTALKINLESMKGNTDLTLLANRVEDSVALIDGVISQTRTLSHELRPSMLDDLGLAAALRWYIDLQSQRANLKAAFTANFPSETRFDPAIETVCFRVAQEALTNVIRHARAKKVLIDLQFAKDEIHMFVRDDGVGFDVGAAEVKARHGAGFGLLGMRERTSLVNGELEVISVPNKGTDLHVHFPVKTSVPASSTEF